jgi:mitogen-activated protein kinase kinase
MQPLQYSQPGPDLAIDYSSPDITVLPPQITTTPRNSSSGPLENVGDLIEELKLINTQTPPVEDDADDMPTEWSDEVIEELQRLGEGAGGAVHKVKDKRSGKILARKTITTRQAEPKQLLREVLIMTTTRHINIIRFYGAYISPSTSEFKILMEYGEGGSLESVSKRIRESGAVVGEKIAGRLTEGVSRPPQRLSSSQA